MKGNRSGSSTLHQGIVTHVNGSQAEVRIERAEACASCSAARLCGAGKRGGHTVSASCPEGLRLSAGDTVVVQCSERQGLRASLWAYAVPLALLVAVVWLAGALLHNEGLAALLAIVSLAVYYTALHYAGRGLFERLAFEVRGLCATSSTNEKISEQ